MYYFGSLSVVARGQQGKLWNHVGLRDVGNMLRRPDSTWGDEVVHLAPAGSVITEAFDASWATQQTIDDIEGAQQRYAWLRRNPKHYALFTNNCEHFAYYIADGTARSPQLGAIGRSVAAGLVLGGLAVVLTAREE